MVICFALIGHRRPGCLLVIIRRIHKQPWKEKGPALLSRRNYLWSPMTFLIQCLTLTSRTCPSHSLILCACVGTSRTSGSTAGCALPFRPGTNIQTGMLGWEQTDGGAVQCLVSGPSPTTEPVYMGLRASYRLTSRPEGSDVRKRDLFISRHQHGRCVGENPERHVAKKWKNLQSHNAE